MTPNTIEDKVANSQAVAVRTKAEEVREYVSTTLAPQLDDVLAQHFRTERFMRIVLNAFRNKPQLMECTKASIGAALMSCAALNLEPNTVLGHAFLIPRKNKQTGQMECHIQIGYKGWIELAQRSREIAEIGGEVVREGDEFEYNYGLNANLYHKPKSEDGKITYVYAYARLKSGGFPFRVWPIAKVDAVSMRGARGQGKQTPWDTDYEEMCIKTMFLRLRNRLPLSPDVLEFLSKDVDAAIVDAEPEQADEVES